MIRFFVAGEPKAMSVGSAFRFKKNGVERHIQSRRHTEWATLVGHIGRQHAPPAPLKGPLSLTALFYLPRPQSAPRGVVFPLKRPDADNLFHKLTDQWNGVFWEDDSQIVDVVIRKRFAHERPGVEITVAPVTVELVQQELHVTAGRG